MPDGKPSITSVAGLTSEQRRFILVAGGNPKDEEGVSLLTESIREQFGVEIDWCTTRRLLTNLRRKNRRRGN